MKILVTILLASLMLQAGLQVDRARLGSVLADRSLVARALIANVIVVPIVGMLVVRVLRLEDAIATGILLMALAPGLPLLPRRGGAKVGGSLDFAVVLAFLLPLVSVVTVPITARFALPAGYEAQVPILQFLTTLVFVELVPLLVGILIATVFPPVAAKLQMPLTIVFFACGLIFVVGAWPMLAKAVLTTYGTSGIIATLCIVLLSFAAGMLLGGPAPEYRHTLAMGTALRNVGLSALVATLSFPDTAVIAAVMCYFIVQLLVSLPLAALLKRTPSARPSGAAG